MAAREASRLGYGIIAAVAAVMAIGAVRFTQSDVHRSRQLLERLSRGDVGAASGVDWEHLHAMGVDVGDTYRRLPNDQERTDYRRGFIAQFAAGFAKTEGSLTRLQGWRVASRTPEATTVTARVRERPLTLVMQLSPSGGRKLEAMEWR